MHEIPAIHSLLSPTHLARLVYDHYTFDEIPSCTLIKSGMNQTYLIETQDEKFILRVYLFRWRSKAEILEEIHLLLKLKEHSLQVSTPIHAANGSYIQELVAPEGIRQAVLFSYAKGEKIRDLNKDVCFHLGKMMAKMHLVTQDLKIERIHYHAETLTKHPYTHAKTYFSENHESMVFIKKLSACIHELYAQNRFVHAARGVVHLDLWYDNMNIDQESNITFFDFDFCGNGWLILDVSYFCMQLFQTEPDKLRYEQKQKAFLTGYESLFQLSESEKELIPYLGAAIWVFYLGVQSQTFNTYSNVFFSDNYLSRFIGMAKNWLNYHQIAIE